ncbi:DUF421 domain-containing protein [Planomonospora parontospora subsp. parontospora]|uniref:DUF421 domain-containing protein n=2 Tax=Planomonospora parontospora TaxID=58119 RepID=A0AA37BPZ8_9ACTN|nr:YetF domain-containing protein [Planomonospora parontospora]GGK99600.1 DUF421 domain-containing protein [Planomonospora parontospora]GII13007.1 DUF421 domain-containing protein [Planomonospora parontospora subsp. parontospora]
MVFDSWSGIIRTIVAAVVAYAVLVAVLRLSGKRTLSKMNAFDLVVTVALGSTLATVVLSSDVALAEGGLALALLVALQFAAAWLATRSALVRRMIKSEPTVVLRDGRLLEDAMRRQRVTPEEVRQAVRSSGSGALEDVAAVVLETDGGFSVIPRQKLGSGSALTDLAGFTGPEGPAGS